jgi:eukaryotic translation initiation factor 2C
MINEVEKMVTELLRYWQKYHGGRFPDQMLYYRDGVSDGSIPPMYNIPNVKADLRLSLGQYAQVKKDKLSRIHAAYKKLTQDQDCKLTAVIVAKCHNVRSYPEHAKDKGVNKYGNCNPGTLVDHIVTSPHFDDFCLQSHKGLQGTARLAHYFVLLNGIGCLRRLYNSL